MIGFVNNSGLESYLSYSSHTAGPKTSGYVDEYSGNLTLANEITSSSGQLVPVSISAFYNGYNRDKSYKNGQKGLTTGLGFSLNVMARLDTITANGSSGTDATEIAKYKSLYTLGYRYVYTDSDGTEHYFKLKDGSYQDEEGLGMTASAVSDGLKLSFKDGSYDIFTSSGYLWYIYDSDNNYARLSYSGANLMTVTDGAGRITNISHDASGRITAISQPASARIVTFSYDTTGHLVSLSYPDGDQTAFGYDASGRLTSVANADGSKVGYSYYDSAYEMINNQISRIQAYGTDLTAGSYVSFSYNDDNTTTITYEVNGGEISELAAFDNYGRIISATDLQDGSATDYSYTSSANTSQANKLASITAKGGVIHNLLLNSSAEYSDSNFTLTQAAVDTAEAYIGYKSYQINSTGSISQPAATTADETYTLTAYAKGSGTLTLSDTASGHSQTFTLTDQWERYSFTYQTAGISQISLSNSGPGLIYVDAIQLESGAVANIYNLMDNTKLTSAYGYTLTNAAIANSRINITASASQNRSAVYRVYINAPASQTVFILSAKAIGFTAAQRDSRLLALKAVLGYTDGSSESISSSFNYDCDGLQYLSLPAAASSANQAKMISYIDYTITFEKTIGTMSFYDPQLFIDKTGTTYTYNDDGELISAKVNGQNQASYGYSAAGELVSATDSLSNNYTYVYASDNTHRLVSAKSGQTGIGFILNYDAKGNNTVSKYGHLNSDSTAFTGKYIETSTGYTADGNYVDEVTGQDGKTTSYSVDAATGQVSSITDASGNTIYYQYDATTNNITSVTSGVQTTPDVGYSYDNSKRLSAITHNGFTYSFTYDTFGNVVSIAAADNTLITNQYAANAGSLTQSSYGNGYTISYQYDAYGRVTTVITSIKWTT